MPVRLLLLPITGLLVCLAVAGGCARPVAGIQGTPHGVISEAQQTAPAARPVESAVPAVAVAVAVTGTQPAQRAEVAIDVLLVDTAGDVIPPAITALGGDRFQRIRLLRVAGKYPLRRREEIVTRGNGGPTIISTREMVADHLLVSLDPAHPVALAAIAAATGSTVRRSFGHGNLALLAFSYTKHEDYPAALQRLGVQAGVRIAESDWIVHATITPNDPNYSVLWGMNNVGQLGGTVDADIDAPEAWAITTGSKNVLVGITDTGIDETHPDLAANIWTNPGETGLDANGHDKATNGIDDDGDGYVDDVHGWDFVNEDNNPHDDQNHGTHCAGTIGAVGNNGKGVTGVCWNVSLVALKFLDGSGSGATSDAVEAQLYATAIGCDLTSNSWGGADYSQALKDAIDAAGVSGRLFVAAAGNSSANNDVTANYPSNYSSANIIAVAATDMSDGLASFSCYGAASVDLGAPGVNIYSCKPGGLYQFLSGTSMATPHVAGACALLKAANPLLTGAQIKAAILANVDPVAALAGKTVSGGRLNLYRAVTAVTGIIVTAPAITITENGDGDGLLNPGEQAVVVASLASSGSATAANIVGTISTTDPAATIETATASFGTLSPGQSASGSVPFRVRLAAGTATPHTVPLTLAVTADGGRSWSFSTSAAFVTSTTIHGTVTRTGTGAPFAGATVTWTGTSAGATPTGSAASDGTGVYTATVGVGSYQLVASASGMVASAATSVTVPPAATVDLTLGASQLVVTPTTLALNETQTSGTVTIANPGDVPLAYAIALPLQASASGLWHQSTYRTVPGSGASWYYGDETKRSYDTGARTGGTLAFKPVTVVAGSPLLTYNSWRSTETNAIYDACQVQVSTNGGSTWSTVQQVFDVLGSWNAMSVSLYSYSGQSVMVRFLFDSYNGNDNNHEGWYISDPRIGAVPITPWLDVLPVQGQVAAGGSTVVQVGFLPDHVDFGTSTTALSITSNAPVGGTAQVAVTALKRQIPILGLKTLAVDDGAAAPAVGDGDGSPEPGESIAVVPTWRNIGYAASGDVTTTLSSSSAYAQVITATAITPSIPAGSAAAAATALLVRVDPATPDNTVIPLTFVVDDGAGRTWTGVSSFTVHWSSRVSGTVRNSLGSPIGGVTVTAGGKSTETNGDGTYAISGLSAGTTVVSAAKTGYTTVTSSITTPPNEVWNPVLPAPRMVLNPASVVMSADLGATTSAPVQVSNVGDAPLTFSFGVSESSPGSSANIPWHHSTYRMVDGMPSWYCGDEVTRTYPYGGTLTLFSVNLPAVSPVFSCQQWRSARSIDSSVIQVSDDGGYNYTTVAETASNLGAWETLSVPLDAYAGKTVHMRFYFQSGGSTPSGYEGWYVNDMRVNGTLVNGLTFTANPPSGTLAPGASTTVMVIGDTLGLLGGTTYGSFNVGTNAPEAPTIVLPVQLNVVTPPSVTIGSWGIVDSGPAPISGDGDGEIQPGETIAYEVILSNTGTTDATGVQATLSSTSPYVTLLSPTATYGTVAGNGSATGSFAIAISPDCPNRTSIPLTYTVTSDNAGTLTNDDYTLYVAWDYKLSGVVTALGSGDKLSSAIVTIAGQMVFTDSNGAFQARWLVPGSTDVSVSKGGYVSTSATLVVPTTGQWNPVLGTRGVSLAPATLEATVGRFDTGSGQLTITNTGTLSTSWTLSGMPDWLSIAPTSGVTDPGATTTVAATFAPAGRSTGVYTYNLLLSTNSSIYVPMWYPVKMTVDTSHAPTATPVTQTVFEDASSVIQLLGADADGDALTYSIVSGPQHGTALLGDLGQVFYQPTLLYHGADSFTYRVSDGLRQSAVTTVTLGVTHVNHVPDAWSTVIHAASGGPVTFQLPVQDLDQDSLTVQLQSWPRCGTLSLSGTTATYTPVADFVGQDAFTFKASDSLSSSGAAQVIISLGGDPADQEWPTLGNGARHLGATAGSLAPFTLTPDWSKSFGYPVHQVAVGGDRVFYTSRTLFNGMRAGALDLTSGHAVWTRDFAAAMNLNPPTYHQGSIYLQRGNGPADSQLWRLDAANGATIWQTPYSEQIGHYQAPTVAGNRVWIDGGYSGGMYGFVRETGTQVFFQQKEQFDQWTPTWAGGVLYAWAGKTLAAHDPQSGALSWSKALPNGGAAYSQFGAAVADDQRIYVVGSSTDYPGPPTVCAVGLTSHAVVWSKQGTYRGMPALRSGKLYVYTAAGIEQLDAASGTLAVTYALTGGTSDAASSVQPIVTADAVIGATGSRTSVFALGKSTARQTVAYGGHLSLAGSRLLIASGNDLRAYRVGNHAPVAANRSASVIDGVGVGVTLWADDADDQLVTWTIGTQPAHGFAFITNGILTYISSAGFGGTDTCTVIANDGTTASAPATVSIQVTPRPVADALTASTQEGDAVAIALHGTSPRNQSLTYKVVTAPATGVVTGALPAAVYTPVAGYAGTVTFTYTVKDEVATSRPATMTITVNARPTAESVTVTTLRELPRTVDLVAVSPRSLPLTYQVVAAPSHGTLSGAFPHPVYSPEIGYTGTDSWAFTVSDGVATSHVATVSIIIPPGLPAGWSCFDIGDEGYLGTAIQNHVTGDIVSTGAGVGMVAASDSGLLVSTNCRGDFDLVALVPLPNVTDSGARVGIMVRDGGDANALGVFVGLAGNKRAIWSRRATTDGDATTSTYAITAATWLKISRRGNSLFSYRSVDGSNWTLCGRVGTLLPEYLLVGSFVASGTTGVPLKARVSQVTLVKPQPAAGGTINIDFQSTQYAPVMLGGTTWSIADGAVFAPRWGGLTYGCDEGTTSTYNSGSPLAPDERYDTGLYAPLATSFEVAVPNGTYSVTVCVGDADHDTGKLRPEVEGVRVVTGTVTAAKHWFTGTVTVVVTDGRLTLHSGTGATANRWAWMQIIPLPTGSG